MECMTRPGEGQYRRLSYRYNRQMFNYSLFEMKDNQALRDVYAELGFEGEDG